MLKVMLSSSITNYAKNERNISMGSYIFLSGIQLNLS